MEGSVCEYPTSQPPRKGLTVSHKLTKFMDSYRKEYEWMWSATGLNLSPTECRIYAYIYGLTESKTARTKGYNGSTRQLSRTLGLSLGATSNALRNLQEEQLIVRQNGVYRTVQQMNDNVQKMNEDVQNMNESVQFMNKSVQNMNPRTPIYINKEKREENNTSCDTIAQTNLSTPSSFNSLFDKLLSAYKAQAGNAAPTAEMLTTCRQLWDDLPEYKQQQLFKAVQNGSWNKSRLEWLISDFKFREPFNYINQVQPTGYSYYFAWHNGARGLYTKQDVDEFHMTNAEHFMDL